MSTTTAYRIFLFIVIFFSIALTVVTQRPLAAETDQPLSSIFSWVPFIVIWSIVLVLTAMSLIIFFVKLQQLTPLKWLPLAILSITILINLFTPF